MNNKEAFKKINTLLLWIWNRARGYMMIHDPWSKKDALRSSAWQGYEELYEIYADFEEPFLTPIINCLERCEQGKKLKAEHTTDEGYPFAAEAFTELAEEMDKIRKTDKTLIDGIEVICEPAHYTSMIDFINKMVGEGKM